MRKKVISDRMYRFLQYDPPSICYDGEPIAAALKANGVMVHRYTSKKHSPRGIFCAIGRCTDCVMIVDGKPNIRTCITPLQSGMRVQTQYGVSPVKEVL